MSTDYAKPIRRPEDITDRSMNDLVERWSNVRMQAFLATHVEKRQPDVDDLFAELAYGTRIARRPPAAAGAQSPTCSAPAQPKRGQRSAQRWP